LNKTALPEDEISRQLAGLMGISFSEVITCHAFALPDVSQSALEAVSVTLQ
jgi:hypothetical protein